MAIIFDAKEEYISNFNESLKSNNYKRYVINFNNFEKSDCFNPLIYPYNLYKKSMYKDIHHGNSSA